MKETKEAPKQKREKSPAGERSNFLLEGDAEMRVKDRRMIGLRLKPELYKQVENLAEKQKKSLNEFLNLFLEKKLQKKTANFI